MARRTRQHARDDNQLTLDFPCATTDAVEDLRPPWSAPQDSADGHRGGRHQPVTAHRGGGTAAGRAGQRTVRDEDIASAGAGRRDRQSWSAGVHAGSALPRRLTPSQPDPDRSNIESATRFTTRVPLRAATSARIHGSRAAAGELKRDLGAEAVERKCRREVKTLAEYVAEIVDAAPPLSGAQRNRLEVLLRASTTVA
jgi:hypothetical protein